MPSDGAAALVEPDGFGPSQPANERVGVSTAPAKRGGTAGASRSSSQDRPTRGERPPMAYPLHDAAADGVPASPDLPAVERAVLDHWERDKTFEASVAQRPAGERGSNEFVFYDGPPFANGQPHWG